MSGTSRSSDYQIRIGNEDIIQRQSHGVLRDDLPRGRNG